MQTGAKWPTVISWAVAVFGMTAGASYSLTPAVSETVALNSAKQFLETVGSNAGSGAPRVSNLAWRSGWEFQFHDYNVQVDGQTGKPLAFRNDRREWEIIHRVGRTGRKRFTSAAQAVAYIKRLARKLGVPASWPLSDPQHAGVPTGRGEVNARFEERPYGYSYLGPGGGNAAYVVLDAQDGALKRWGMETAVVADPPKLRIPKQQAMAAAQKAYREYYRDGRSFHGGPVNAARVKLGYARPVTAVNGTAHARLTWQVVFGEEPVLVDADTGATEVVAMK